jgi:hypothetical protein
VGGPAVRCSNGRLVAQAVLQLSPLRREHRSGSEAAGDRGQFVITRDHIAATRPSSGAASVRTYARGRVCRAVGCGTVLSAYNSSAFCAVHEGVLRRKRRARRPVLERACAHCGATFETANEKRRYCSDRCRMTAFARRKRSITATGGSER